MLELEEEAGAELAAGIDEGADEEELSELDFEPPSPEDPDEASPFPPSLLLDELSLEEEELDGE